MEDKIKLMAEIGYKKTSDYHGFEIWKNLNDEQIVIDLKSKKVFKTCSLTQKELETVIKIV